MRKVWWYLIAIAALAIILIAPMVMYQGEDMQGADDSGADPDRRRPMVR